MAVAERLEEFQRKHQWAGFPLAVLYKYVDDFGPTWRRCSPTTGSYRCSRCCCCSRRSSASCCPANPFRARGRSLLLLATAGLAMMGTPALSIAGGSGVGAVGIVLRVAALVASVMINIAVFVFGFRFAAARRLSVRDVAPGAVAAAVIWQLLQSFGVIYARHMIGHASATNAVFAVVLGMLAFLYISATAVLLCAEINVVRVSSMHPRSLLTPFTDNVILTTGDRRTYSRQAKAQRRKGFEHVDVNFDPPSPEPEPDDPSP